MWRSTLIAGAVLLVAGCTPDAPPSRPVPSPVFSTPVEPSASPTPSLEELQKQALAAYEVAFDEYERLSREGGADQPSPKMLEVEHGRYLEQDMLLLRYQKQHGFRVEGGPAKRRARPAAGRGKDSADSRLTLQICEDRRASSAVNPNGNREKNKLWQGFVFVSVIEDRVKLVDADATEVQSCDW